MTTNTYRHGALMIVESVRPKADIERAIKDIDDRLFLEQQITIEGQCVWCVVVALGSDEPPVTILEWRDENEAPIHELSSGIIERVNRMERDGKRLAANVIRRNQARLDAKRRETQAHWADIGYEAEKRMSPGYSAVLHRGQFLRRSRDKQRSRGWNV